MGSGNEASFAGAEDLACPGLRRFWISAWLVLSNEQGCIPGIGSQFVVPHCECEISFCPKRFGKQAGACSSSTARSCGRPGCHPRGQPGFQLYALVHHPAMQQLLDSEFTHHELCACAAKRCLEGIPVTERLMHVLPGIRIAINSARRPTV